MSDSRPNVTEMELAVLRVLWERGPATIREISQRVYPGGGATHYATVQKLLERLEEKGCVSRDRSERAHRFETTVSRDDFLGDRLRDLAEKVCGGSLAPLLSSLVSANRLTAQQRELLRKLVEKLERESKRQGGRD